MNILPFLLGKLNETEVKFAGSYMYRRWNQSLEVFTYNMDTLQEEKLDANPVSIISELDTPYVDGSERTDITYIVGAMLRAGENNEPIFDETRTDYLALRGLKDKINGKTFTINTKKVNFKASQFNKRGEIIEHAKHDWVYFEAQITCTIVTSGFFGNDATVEMRVHNVGTYHTLDWLDVPTSMGKTGNPVSPVGVAVNTYTNVHSRTLNFTVIANYHGGTLEDALIQEMWGKGTRKTKYDLKITLPQTTTALEYVVKVLRGAPEIVRGGLQRISIELEEVKADVE